MADNNLASELKRIGFAPQRGGYKTAPYPFDIRCDSYDYDLPTARVMGFKSGAQELVDALRQSMRDSDFDSECILRHPTFVMLQRSLPPRAHTETRNGHHIFTHYDRIGWWGLSGERYGARNRLVGMAHVRHVATIKSDTEYRYAEEWHGFAVYRLQLLNLWDALDGDGRFERALEQRALDYIGQIGSAAMNVADSVHDGDYFYSHGRIPVIAEVQHPYLATDLIEDVGKVAAALSPLTDDRSEGWSSLHDNGAILSGVLIRPMSQDDEDEIEKVTAEGIGTLKPAPLPKASAATKHILVEVTDKHLVLLRKGLHPAPTIGHTNYDHKGRAVRWRLVVDEGSRVFYVEPLVSKEDERDITGFLERAWARKPNLVFEGPPQTLEVPKSYLKKWPKIDGYLSDKGVDMVHPTRGLGLGIAIGRTWLEDSRMATSGTGLMEFTLLKQWATEHQLVVAAQGWYCDPNDKHAHSHELWKLGRRATCHYTGIRVDTRAYMSAIGRDGAEAMFREHWPTQDKE